MTQNFKKEFFIRLGIRICGLLVIFFGVTSLSSLYRSLDNNIILESKYAMVEDLHNGMKAFTKDMVENEQDLIERGQLNDYKRGLSEFRSEVEKYRTGALEPRAVTISFFISDFILGIFLILGGLGLIRLKNEGRKNAIICCGIMMLVSIISLSRNYFMMSRINAVFEKTDYMNSFFYPNTEPLYLSMSFEWILNHPYRPLIYLMVGYYVLLSLPIIFLTRPKIKALFSPQRGEAGSKEVV